MSVIIFGEEYNIDTTELNLSYNRIEEIPKEIQYLTQLTKLDLNYNKIKELPTEIQYLTQLTFLCLESNQIEKELLERDYNMATINEWLEYVD